MEPKVIDTNLVDRLFEKRLITTVGDHWLFVGAQIKGYGALWYQGKLQYTHRLAAYLWLGLDLGSNDQSNHKIECTQKSCFNPEHLYVGRQLSNMQDESVAGRHHESIKTHCPQGHEYTPENTRYLTHLLGNPRRDCKTCHNINNKKYRDSQKRKNATKNN